MDKFNELREKYPVFEYNSYDIIETENSFEVSFNFGVPNLTEFKTTWSFPKPEDVVLD